MSTTRTPNALPPYQEDSGHDGAGLMGQVSTPHYTSCPSYIVGIGAAQFFRDPGAFTQLEHLVIPKLVQQAESTGTVRVWVSACATGEEAYTIAMLIREQCDLLAAVPEIKIFATDVDPKALQVARTELYPQSIAADVSPQRLQRFFVRHRAGYQVQRELRELLILMPHNLLQDPPLAQMDLIVCRHILSDIKPRIHYQVLNPLYFALPLQGYLFLGPSDALGTLEDACLTLHPQWKLFQKTRDVQLSTPMPRPPHATAVAPLLERLQERLIALYGPPTLVVNEQQEVVHMSGDVSLYVRPASGILNVNVLQVLIDDLVLPVQAMLQRIATEQDEVVHPHIAVRVGDESQHVTLRGHWVPALGKTPNLAMLCFETAAADTPWYKGETKGMALRSRPHIESLEQRLQQTQETLQSTLADLESSYADLQCRHDEILASHVELQSTHETLQAANAVLYAVNVEYRNKMAELTRLNQVGNPSQHR